MNLESFEQLTKQRRTVKVLAQDTMPVVEHRLTIQRLLSAAGWAPFHKVCSADHRDGDQRFGATSKGIEPWRFHALDADACRKLRTLVIDKEGAGKIPLMLAAADAMIMATWLPNSPSVGTATSEDHESFEPTLGNVEHIAAASAAVQSLLLAGTAAGFETYWSSGGVLRTPEIFGRLNIPSRQRLLGAIFLFPAGVKSSPRIEIAESKLRQERHPVNSWSRWVEL